MSLDLYIRTYPGTPNDSTIERFCTLVEAVASWHQDNCQWAAFEIENGRSHETVTEVYSPLTTEQLIRLARDSQPAGGRCYYAAMPFPYWRWEEGKPCHGHAWLSIRSWDRDGFYGDPAIEGNATVSINPAKFYWVILDEKSVDWGREYNEHVEDNLEELGTLMMMIVQASSCRSAKMFVDRGWDLPINAHVAYFRNSDAVIADLNLLDRIWKDGLPNYGKMPPLRDYHEAEHEMGLSCLRPKEQRKSLWEDLNRRLPLRAPITEHMINEALKSPSMDVMRQDEGFFIFDFPHFLNSFIAPFYLDVLDQIARPVPKV